VEDSIFSFPSGTSNRLLGQAARIYKEKFKSHVDMGRFGLAPGFELVTVHNFLWHYYEYYKKGKSWGGQKRSL